MSGQRPQGERAAGIPEGGLYTLQSFDNTGWYKCFFIHHDLHGKDDIPAVDAKKHLGCIEDELTSFLHVSDEFASSCEADEVKRYCEGGASLDDVQHGIGDAVTRPAAWIDDRNSPQLSGRGRVRLCGKLLTATELLRHLKQPVWIAPDLLDRTKFSHDTSDTNTVMSRMQSDGLCKTFKHPISCTRN